MELEARSRRDGQTQMFIETPYRNPALFEALLRGAAPGTLLCVAVDLSLPAESVRTHSIAAWRKLPAPELRKRPAVFLLLGQQPT